MTTSPETSWKLASSLEDKQIDPVTLGYFHGLSQDEAHETVLSIFLDLARTENITRAFIARRLDKSPEQVTRWLAGPGNWTLDTYTNLLLAMGHRPAFGAERLSDMRQSNQHHKAVSTPPLGNFSVKMTLNASDVDKYELPPIVNQRDKNAHLALALAG